ncbi:carboxymuconolactone decarboxylase family protein [Bradyrhizobium sp. LHD-71]|uniref:carboxymuconolactone decarboxylase family protein n=1 Tax=Bradyrhizobium sp. LHD-71 TaxID=3072141 RepID=UPI00280FDAF5|nr:carboxymuconolactone decarboxylase family protein [Bradyrhizobium sp. LHD-71]MDQ8730957.1 carboxymuconolactone decarboxylase family protein [Bradyrhizobium sp. LHD-71]
MRLAKPRIEPVPDDKLSADQAELLAPMLESGRVLNIFRTLVTAPKAAKGFFAWANYVLSRRNDLPAREREIVILRIGFLCKSGYEWTQHTRIAIKAGLSEDEIARIKVGANAPGWSAADAALLNASDELHHDQFISDATWSALRNNFTEKQCMDVVFTAGQYTQVSMILNTFGVQLDKGQTLDPELKGF